MPSYSVDIVSANFASAVKFAIENTQKDIPTIVNRGALVAIIGGRGVKGAMQRTPKASAAAIREVDVSIIAAVVRRKHRGEKLKKADMRRLIKKEYARRVAAIGYTANVGWNNAAIVFGGRGIGGRAAGKGFASMGSGQRATQTTGVVTATMTNTAPGAIKVGQQALQDALDDTGRDIREHIEQKMGQRFSEASR